MTPADHIAVMSEAAEAWRDPEHPPRRAAVEATLAAPNRWTEEGLAFALNHRAHQATPATLAAWLGSRAAVRRATVGVLCGESAPLAGWTAALAAMLLGHEAVIGLSESSPALLPAFWDEVPGAAVTFVSRREVLDRAEALVAEGTEPEEEHALVAEAEAAGLPASRRLLSVRGSLLAVLGGREDAATLSGLAEDLLLHEGVGAPGIVWAPAGLAPDALLNALAGFREYVPAHPDTDGTLALPTAFLASAKQPHATGSGFLVSKGAPEPQAPAHLRWAEYASLAEVSRWLRAQPPGVAVVAAPEVAERLEGRSTAPGDVHRPGLDEAVAAFLASV